MRSAPVRARDTVAGIIAMPYRATLPAGPFTEVSTWGIDCGGRWR
jgi:hypothetical protein